jgi:hypothetical protein
MRYGQCPYCNGEIPANATRCIHCGRTFSSAPSCLFLLICGLALVGIVLIIAVPAFIPPRKARNEHAAVSMLHAIGVAQEKYKNTKGWYLHLEELVAQGLLEEAVLLDDCSGYRFIDWVQSGGLEWSVTTVPVELGITGDRSYYMDVCGVIRYKLQTGPNDPPADERSMPLPGPYP